MEGSGASMVLGSQPSLAQPRQPMTRLRTPPVTFMPFRCPGRRGGPGLLCPASRFVLGCQRLPPEVVHGSSWPKPPGGLRRLSHRNVLHRFHRRLGRGAHVMLKTRALQFLPRSCKYNRHAYPRGSCPPIVTCPLLLYSPS